MIDNEDEKEGSFDDSFSPPPEELNIRMPEMSALVVNKGSHINELSRFNLDDIFGNNTKSTITQPENKLNNIIPNDISAIQINPDLQNPRFNEQTKTQNDSINNILSNQYFLITRAPNPNNNILGENITSNSNTLNDISIKNIVNVNDIAKKLLDFSMIVQKIEVNNEIEGKILISSSKSVNSALIKMIKEMKEKENFDELQNDINKDKMLLDEQFVSIDGFEQKVKDMKESSEKLKKQIEDNHESIKILTDENIQLSNQVESVEKQFNELETKNKELSKEKNKLKTKLDNLQSKISEMNINQTKTQEEISLFKTQNIKLEENNKNQELKKIDIDSELEILSEKFNRLNKIKENLENETAQKLSELNSKLSQNKELLEKYNLQLDSIVLKELELEKIKKQNEEYLKKSQQLDKDLNMKQDEFNKENEQKSKLKKKLQHDYNQLCSLDKSTKQLNKDTNSVRNILKEFKSILAKSKAVVNILVKIEQVSSDQKPKEEIHKKKFENNFSDEEDHISDQLSLSDSFSEQIISKQYQSHIQPNSAHKDKMQKYTQRLTINDQNKTFKDSHFDFDDNMSDTSQIYNFNKIDKELQKLSFDLSKARQTLLLLEKDNKMLKQLKDSIKKDLSYINEKIEDNKVYNKFLLENNESKEDLFDKILDQIKILRELKIEEKIKNERVKTNVIEFLTQEKEHKSDMIKDVESLESFLDNTKNQIQKLHIPNILKLVHKNVDIDALKKHNENLDGLEEQEINQRQDVLNRSMMSLKRSSQYNSTGNLLKFKENNFSKTQNLDESLRAKDITTAEQNIYNKDLKSQ